jgi:hypothetical protein
MWREYYAAARVQTREIDDVNQYEMVALIVLVACAAGIARSWIKHRAHLPPADPAHDQRVAKLEERVRALEAIVTDQGYDLRKQFKDLEK